jgi:hypothetical protein
MSGKKIWGIYINRFQIEFLFRDAKGHLGLEHCQSRQENALDFHFNHVLTTPWKKITPKSKNSINWAELLPDSLTNY